MNRTIEMGTKFNPAHGLIQDFEKMSAGNSAGAAGVAAAAPSPCRQIM